jgi:pimeloyl-ACP methyl ester carboxylesterase
MIPEGPEPPRKRRRWPRIVARIVLGLVGAFLAFILFVAPYLLVRRLALGRNVYNDRENAGLTPASFELASEDVEIRSADGLALRGWWVPATSARGSVVLVHGLNRSRIEHVRKTPFLHDHGWNALAFDLRHHGASEGDRSTFGWQERLDVRAAVAEARRRSPGPVVVWGVSLGAASAMLAAAEDSGIDGVVCDSSYRSLEDTMHHHLQLLRGLRGWLRLLPGGLVSEEMLFWVRRIDGFDTHELDIERAASRLGSRPVLFVSNSGDRRMPTDIAFDLKAAAGPGARVLVVPGHSHGGAYREGKAAYESAVLALLDEVLARRL